MPFHHQPEAPARETAAHRWRVGLVWRAAPVRLESLTYNRSHF
jgi:hypothetical protein